MTDSQAREIGSELLKLVGDDPLEADDAILISLGRAAVKICRPIVLEELREGGDQNSPFQAFRKAEE